MNIKWLESERQYIRDNCDEMKDVDIAKELTRMTQGRRDPVSLQAVRKQRQKMGLSKIPGRGKCGLVKNDIN